MDDHKKIRACSYLLPDPGGEVVRDLLDELARKDLEMAELRTLITHHENEAKKDSLVMTRAAITCRRGKVQVLAMREALRPLVAIAKRFCDRVESGEVRSVRTYADFKRVLGHPLVKPFLEGM